MTAIPEAVKRRLETQYHPSLLSHSSDDTLHSREHTPHEADQVESSILSHPSPDNMIITNIVPHLPTEPVTAGTISALYAAFILYCNPMIPPHTNTTELQDIFMSPPKSDGKSFKTWALFELIKKLDSKELKTWAQLALDLGVEPPALEKGQSAQKVQQYAVRLKRWMHALHVDAFFEYLLGKPHPYYENIPALNSSQPPTERDGVPSDEDLALRALLPELRPKRGRRKNEDRDDVSLSKSPAQRPRLASPTLSEDFQLARSAIVPEPASALHHSFDGRSIPWSAIDDQGQPGAFHWPPADSSNFLTPHTAYPHSAIVPTSMHSWDTEPRSAITPRARSRRKHGPAVSSAWTPNSAGKLRGRPPNNRSTQDGPFSTFPANPTPAKPVEKDFPLPLFTHDITRDEPRPVAPSTLARPARLSLQVPQRQGGEVRLATPPPIVLVNSPVDIENTSQIPPNQNINPSISLHQNPTTTSTITTSHIPTQPPPNLSTPQSRMSLLRQQHDPDTTNVSAVETHLITQILLANWTDSSGTPLSPENKCTITEATLIVRQLIRDIKNQAFSEEMFLLNLTSALGAFLISRPISIVRGAKDVDGNEDREGWNSRNVRDGKENEKVDDDDDDNEVIVYKYMQEMRFGSFQKIFASWIKIPKRDLLVAVDAGIDRKGEDVGRNDGERNGEGGEVGGEVNWKKRYEDLKRESLMKQEQARKMQRDLVGCVLEVGASSRG